MHISKIPVRWVSTCDLADVKQLMWSPRILRLGLWHYLLALTLCLLSMVSRMSWASSVWSGLAAVQLEFDLEHDLLGVWIWHIFKLSNQRNWTYFYFCFSSSLVTRCAYERSWTSLRSFCHQDPSVASAWACSSRWGTDDQHGKWTTFSVCPFANFERRISYLFEVCWLYFAIWFKGILLPDLDVSSPHCFPSQYHLLTRC